MFGIYPQGNGHRPHSRWGHISEQEARPRYYPHQPRQHGYSNLMSSAPLGSPPLAQTPSLSIYTTQQYLYPHDTSQTPNFYTMSSPDGRFYGESEEYSTSSPKLKILKRKVSRPSLLGRAVRRSASYGAVAGNDSDVSEYRKYRSSSSGSRTRRKSSAIDDKWGDDVKAAFIDACYVVPKIGKGKKFLNGKMCGRNELISDHIEKLTGKYRCRKQVSSHIQVLKNRHKDNAEFLQLLSSTPPGVDEDSDLSSSPDSDEPWPQSPYHAGSPSSQSDATSFGSLTPSQNKGSTTSAPADFEYLNQPTFGPSSLSAAFGVSVAPKVFPSAFHMWVSTESVMSGQVEGCVHTYSSLSQEHSHQQSAVPLVSVPSWASRFPIVAELFEKNEITPQCTVLQFSVSVETQTFAPPPKSVLCTQFELTVPGSFGNLFETRTWECVTRIYAPDQKVWEFSHNVPVSESLDTRKLSLPFASDFWSVFFSNLSKSQMSGSNADCREQNNAKTSIKGITVVQEVFYYSASRINAKERAALIMFDFTKAEPGQIPSAVWREIISPVSVDLSNPTPAHTVQPPPTFLPSNAPHDGWPHSAPPSSFSRFSPGPNIPIGIYDDLSPATSFYNSYNSSFTDDIGLHTQQPQTIAPVEVSYGHQTENEFASPFLMSQDGEMDDCAMSPVSHDDDSGFWKEEE